MLHSNPKTLIWNTLVEEEEFIFRTKTKHKELKMNKHVNKVRKATGRAEAITASNADFYMKLGEEVHGM